MGAFAAERGVSRFGDPVCDCEVAEHGRPGVLHYRIRSLAHSYIKHTIVFWTLATVVSAVVLYFRGTLRSQWWSVAFSAVFAAFHVLGYFLKQQSFVRNFGPGMDEALRMAVNDTEYRWRRSGR